MTIDHHCQRTLAMGNLQSPIRTSFGVLLDLNQFEELGQDGHKIMLECGIPAAAMEEPEYQITSEMEQRVLSRLTALVSQKTELAAYALENGIKANIELFGILGLAAVHAKSMLAAYRIILSHPELTWGHSRLLAGETSTHAIIEFSLEPNTSLGSNAHTVRDFLLTRDLVSSATLSKDIGGPSLSPVMVSLPFAAPECSQEYLQHFNCPVQFSSNKTRLYYPLGLWQHVPPRANELIFKGYEKITNRLASQLRVEPSYSELVKSQLWVNNPMPNRSTIASQLGLSTRTLARKLKAESTHFGELLKQAQLAKAESLLRNGATPLADIAEHLGFSDLAAFSRAFKNWTGQPPSSWRR